MGGLCIYLLIYFLGHAHINTLEDTHITPATVTRNCTCTGHTRCLPDAGVFHFPPTSQSSLTAGINEFIAHSFKHKDTESFTKPREAQNQLR